MHCPSCGHESRPAGRLRLAVQRALHSRPTCKGPDEDDASGWGATCVCSHPYHRR